MEKVHWKPCHNCEKVWPSKGPDDNRMCGGCRDEEKTAGLKDALKDIAKLPLKRTNEAPHIAAAALKDFGR